MAIRGYRGLLAVALACLVLAGPGRGAQAAVIDWNDVHADLLDVSKGERYVLQAGDTLEIPVGDHSAVGGSLIIYGTCTMLGGTLELAVVGVLDDGALIINGTLEADVATGYFTGKLVCGTGTANLKHQGINVDVEYLLNPDGGTIPGFAANEQVQVWFPFHYSAIPADLTPAKTGYTFAGWDTNAPNITKGSTVTALWAAKPAPKPAPANPTVRPLSDIPKTGDDFPFLWLACAMGALLLGAGVLLALGRRQQD